METYMDGSMLRIVFSVTAVSQPVNSIENTNPLFYGLFDHNVLVGFIEINKINKILHYGLTDLHII